MNTLPCLKTNHCSLCDCRTMVWQYKLLKGKYIALCKNCIGQLFGILVEKYNEEKMLNLIRKYNERIKAEE